MTKITNRIEEKIIKIDEIVSNHVKWIGRKIIQKIATNTYNRFEIKIIEYRKNDQNRMNRSIINYSKESCRKIVTDNYDRS